MNLMTISKFKATSVDKIKELLPLTILVNEDVAFVVCDPEETIVLQDLHPAVKIQLRAREKRARAGMPVPDLMQREYNR